MARSCGPLKALLILMALGSTGAGGLRAAPALSLLYLEEADSLRPAYSAFIAGFRQTLTTNYPGRINLYTENLDLPHFDSPAYRLKVEAWLRTKYQAVPLDAVVASGDLASECVLRMRQTVWPEVPVILVSAPERPPAAELPARTTRVEMRFETRQTLELALRLYPQAKRIVVVGATVPGYAKINGQIDTDLTAFATAHGLEIQRVQGLTMAGYRERLATIPADSLIYYLGLSVDASGTYVGPREALKELSPLLKAPVFVTTETCLGYGAVGGSCYQFAALGAAVARQVQASLRVPAAAPAPAAPPPDCSRVMLDWRQLQRFDLRPAAVPAGAMMLFRPPTLWEEHRGTVILALGALLLQSATIVVLLLHRAKLRRAEGLQHESQQRCQLLVEASFEGIAISEQGRLTEVNDQLLAMLGYRREELLGTEVAALLPPEHREQVAQDIAEGRPVRSERELLRKDGARLPVAIQGRTGIFHDRQVCFSALRDMTESQRAARELQAHREQLAHAGRVSALGLLASSLAHELTQPLTAILQNAESAEMLLESHPAGSDELMTVVRNIKASDLRAVKVIASMRALLTRQELEFKPQDLAAILQEAVDLVEPDAARRQVAIRTEVCGPLGPVVGDRIQLQQVVLNLLVNALQAVGASAAGERKILVCARQHFDGGVRVEVTDSGPGLPAASRGRLFEPFFTTKPTGLGMGLAISRRIIESHQGYLGAQNNPQGGATFWIELPGVSVP